MPFFQFTDFLCLPSILRRSVLSLTRKAVALFLTVAFIGSSSPLSATEVALVFHAPQWTTSTISPEKGEADALFERALRAASAQSKQSLEPVDALDRAWQRTERSSPSERLVASVGHEADHESDHDKDDSEHSVRPIIQSISPDNVAAGQVVSIAGSNFGASRGTIGLAGVSSQILSWSNSSISFRVPNAVKTGADAVVLTTVFGGLATGTLHVLFAPSISSISPTVGVPYTPVTVIGSGFGASTPGTVTFNTVAGKIQSWSDTKIVVKAPDGAAGRGPVVVSWQGVSSNGITFNYVPTLLYLSNATVARTYGSFAIVGQNFLAQPGTVTLNGVRLNIYSWSNNSISLPVPQDNCTGPIVVTTQYGDSNSAVLTILGSTAGCNSTGHTPGANAGPNQTVFVHATVQLDGSGSTDRSGHPLTYHWSFISVPSGSAAMLSDAKSVKPTFVADKPGSYTVQLVVNDGFCDSSASRVIITTKNSPPIANAGPNQTVKTHALAQLDGSGSTDVDGDTLSYRWLLQSKPAGSNAALSGATLVNPTFTADQKGSYVVQLIVNDGQVDSVPSTVTINTVNSPPVANPGANQKINVGATIQLNGSGSTDVDGDALSYRWAILSKPTASNATLSSTKIVNPTLVGDAIGDYIVQLIVNDGIIDSQPATITISTADVAPVANAGSAQSVAIGTRVALDGTASTDAGNRALTYQWSLLSAPSGSTAAILPLNSSNPFFTADRNGSYVAQLIVNDGYLNSLPSTVIISTINSVPVADPGPPQTVPVGTTVSLSGAASGDADGDPLTYKWTITSQPVGGSSILSNATSLSPAFVASLEGIYVIQLIVNDGRVDSAPKTLTITATTPNQAPVVNAGSDQAITLPVNMVALNGSVHDDGKPMGAPVTTSWSGPPAVSFSNSTAVNSQATFAAPGVYVLHLTASDTQLSSSSDVTITVNPPTNLPPVVSAGANASVPYPNTYTLQGSVTDDGKPAGKLTSTWSQVSGPSGASPVIFTNAHSPASAVTLKIAGSYVLRLTGDDTQLQATSDVTITAIRGNQPPRVNAGSDQTIPLSANSVMLSGSATDDGLPQGSSLVYSWSKIAGPAASLVIFSSPTALTSSATFSAAGVYVLRLSASDSELTGSADVHITVQPHNNPPVVSAGPAQTIFLPNGATLLGMATDDGFPLGGKLTTAWSVTSGPGIVTFSNGAALSTTASFSAIGNYVLRLTASDSELSSLSEVSISVRPANQPPVVSAGPSQTIILPTITTGLPRTPTLIPISTGFNSAMAIDYSQAANKLVTSVNAPSGLPYNFELIGSDGARTQFSALSGLTGQIYMAMARDEGSGRSRGGFLAGEMLAGSGVAGVIIRVSPDGSKVQNPWVTLANETGQLHGQLYIDRTGVFGGDLIVSTTSGNIWRVNSAGMASLLANIGVSPAEGLVTVPADTLRYGPWSGKIIAGSTSLARIFAIDPQGNVSLSNLAIAPQHIKLVNANESYFGIDPASNLLWSIPAPELAGMTGDLLMGEASPGNLWQIRWNGSQFETTRFAQAAQWQGATLAPAGLAPVAPRIATAILQGTVTDDGLPATGGLSMAWSQITGPGTATFSSASALATSVTFSEGGTYTLRLTASDSELSSSSDVTVVIGANRAPTVEPGTDQEIFASASATLQGTVSDDGLPGGTLYNFWTKVTGPGNVSFGTPTYDAGADFSATSNPSGTWTYGLQDPGSAFAPYTFPAQGPGLPFFWFRAPGAYAPLLNYNGTGATFTDGSPMEAADSFTLHPSSYGSRSVLRWTAPRAGSFLVQGRFFAADVDGTTTDAAVVLNSSTVLLAGNVMGLELLPGDGAGVPFSFIQSVQAGDTLDFSIGVGTDGTYLFDSTGLKVAITQAGDASTTASFSLPGDYDLRLTGYDTELRSSKDVHVRVISPCVPAPAGVVGEWPGEGNANDLVGGNNGVITGAQSFAPGIVGESFNFTGDSDVTIPTIAALNNQSFTLEAWIYPTDSVGVLPILEFTGGDVANGPFGPRFYLNFNSSFHPDPGALYAEVRDTAGRNHVFSTGSAAVALRQWSHVALSFDQNSGQARIYVNGVAVAVANFDPFTPQTSVPLHIGVQTGTSNHFPGQIDEVAAFNRVLSQGEILSIFAAGSQGKCQSTTPPTQVSAGPNQTIALPTNQVTLHGIAVDPGGAQLSTIWSQVSGPGTVTFANPSATITTASFSALGTYGLRLSAAKGSLITSSDVIIIVTAGPNQPPQITVGRSYTLPWPVKTLSLNATVTDDGLPQGSTVTQQWSQVSGPGAVTFDNPNQAATQVTFPAAGTFVLQLSANDTRFLITASITVTVLTDPGAAPQVTIAPVPQIQVPNAAALSAVVVAPGLPSGAVLTLQWSMTSGPGAVTFANPGLLNTAASFSLPGAYVLRLTASDTLLTGFGEIAVTVLASTTPPPTVSISSPASDTDITKPTPVIGTVSNGIWQLQYGLNTDDDSAKLAFTTFASGSGLVTNGVLGTFDPTVLVNGLYTIRLTTTDDAGQIRSTSISVTVSRNLKLGNFTLSFQDISVPMPGLPIAVTRTYDSRDRRVGDFGAGWTLSVANVRVQKNGPTGQGWDEEVSWSGGFDRYCLQPTKNHFVTITFPGNQVYKFQATASPECQSFGPISAPTVVFVQVATGSTTAGATLVPSDGGLVLTDGSIPGPQSLIDYSSNVYNPTQFQLTTAEGYVYALDQQLGVTQITDLNGNTLTINANGIIHSSGKSVVFTRDAQNRIISITDPSNAAVRYAYDAAGNLSAIIDRVNNTTTFTYDNNHYLTGILDPRGVQAVTNVYDDSGRLTDTFDASGVTHIHYDHQLPKNAEVITDRLGNPSTYVYDDDGNVLSMTDALNHTTSYTFDANDNTLTATDALGRTSTYTYDSLGNRLTETVPLDQAQNRFATTITTYNARKQVQSTTDALNRRTTQQYDGQDNLILSVDSMQNPTSMKYKRGLLVEMRDALQHPTAFDYDGVGQLITQTDALHNVTSFAYDANGNRTSRQVTRTGSDGLKETLTTTYLYDGQNRLIKTVLPDQTSTRTEYNAIGKEAATFDPLQRKTSYDYDASGRLVKTTYSDQSFESSTYDAENHLLTSTDRSGNTTLFSYDPAGRLTQVTNLVDNSATHTIYDAAGQSTSTIDSNNNQTTYVYDDDGRRTSVTDALNHTTRFTYDDVGQQIAFIDARGNTVRYKYDDKGARTEIDYPDMTFQKTTYDTLGRLVSNTDPGGQVTTYGYDDLSRLATVTQLLNGNPLVTSYGYDEVGERVTQTDANGHITSFAYDQLGRRISRTLPLGMHESYGYDAVGNMLSKTDFNGHTTAYQFDSLSRLTGKTADAFFSTGACAAAPGCGPAQIGFTYTALGQRHSMTDASGVTTYAYDNRNRLLTEATPFGTLSYTYDAAGNVLSLQSSNAGGASMTYAYDALNRPASVTDSTGVTNYSYDAAGNLAGYAYPNGVSTTYNYNTLNRLTNMQSICATGTGCGAPQTALASYAYTLGPTGNRLSVAELNGRTVQYGYDDLYRLTSETVVGAAAQNGSISYTYDAVGNRTQRNSTLPALPATGLLNYDANDRTATDHYDSNGNTVVNASTTNVYDFENHLIQHGGVTILYDGDGNRVSKTVGGVTTAYLVDTNNPTGYAQVVEELQGGTVTRKYSYGLQRINETQTVSSTLTTSFYGYDGHGSVRQLTDSTGAVTDTYDFDAFGNLINSTGFTPNKMLFAGEEFDVDLGLYYNRARYLDVRGGRFWSMDSHEGNPQKPESLQKYLYASANPVNDLDPSGYDDLAEMTAANSIGQTIDAIDATTGFAALDQVLYGGNAGLKSIAMGAVMLGAQGIEVAAIGRMERSAPLELPSGRPGKVIPNGMLSSEMPFAEEIVQFRGGTLEGPPTANFPGVDGFLDHEPVSFKEFESAGKTWQVSKRVLKAESQAEEHGFYGVEVYVRARNVSARDLLNDTTTVSEVTETTRRPTVTAVNVLTKDGWIRISAAVLEGTSHIPPDL